MNAKLYLLPKLESKISQYLSEGNFEEALTLGNQLLDVAKEIKDYDMMMKAYMNLISCYYHLGQIENAFRSFVQYKKLYDQYGNTIHQFHLYSLSALLFEYAGNLEKAKEMVEECVKIAFELDMFHEASVIYNTYASYLYFERNYKKAEEISLLSLHLAKEHSPGDVLLLCQIHFNIALVNMELGKLEEARIILASLENNPYIHDHLYEKSFYYYTYGIYYVKTNELSQALSYFQKSYFIYSHFNQELMLKRVLKEMIALYEQLKNFYQCYEKMKEYITISEHIESLHLSCKLLELDIKNDFAQMEKQAYHDGLTGIYNRYFLEITCNKWLTEVKETGESVCCVIIDIDNFKNINDTFGHLIGDKVIKTVAQATKDIFEEKNTIVGRYGGDEFIVFLRGYSIEKCINKAKQLFCHLDKNYITYLKNQIEINVSIGIASTDSMPIAKKFTQLFKLADQALYMAKKEGKNQIVSLSSDNCNTIPDFN